MRSCLAAFRFALHAVGALEPKELLGDFMGILALIHSPLVQARALDRQDRREGEALLQSAHGLVSPHPYVAPRHVGSGGPFRDGECLLNRRGESVSFSYIDMDPELHDAARQKGFSVARERNLEVFPSARLSFVHRDAARAVIRTSDAEQELLNLLRGRRYHAHPPWRASSQPAT